MPPPQVCLAQPRARVISVEGRQVTKQPPNPLSTLELQKRATVALRMPGERIMSVAESLYQAGFVSYPRTETDRFSPNTDLAGLLGSLADCPPDIGVSEYISRLRDPQGDLFRWPPGGGNDDQAHPPIHPTKAPSDADWAGWQVSCVASLPCCSSSQ